MRSMLSSCEWSYPVAALQMRAQYIALLQENVTNADSKPPKVNEVYRVPAYSHCPIEGMIFAAPHLWGELQSGNGEIAFSGAALFCPLTNYNVLRASRISPLLVFGWALC